MTCRLEAGLHTAFDGRRQSGIGPVAREKEIPDGGIRAGSGIDLGRGLRERCAPFLDYSPGGHAAFGNADNAARFAPKQIGNFPVRFIGKRIAEAAELYW
jgi:hypothetical protein